MSALARPRHPLGRRAWNKWRRFTLQHCGRREFTLRGAMPYVSFTFDDFPCSASAEGARILAKHGVRGTYFVSCRLLDGPSPSGPIASRADLVALLRDGHELGCHTFEHLDGCASSVDEFEHSIATNRAVIKAMVPEFDGFETFAYPLDGPVLPIKKAVGTHFVACRGGGQTFNDGAVDLNLLKAYFFDYRTNTDLEPARRIIARNAAQRGWLIFATHDVTKAPSRYGCTPEFFEQVVQWSVQSGARVLPMAGVLRELGLVNERRPAAVAQRGKP
jgi:peptidoglycan/xylan/chitin deacetylase (PgdA/CDA1 family)